MASPFQRYRRATVVAGAAAAGLLVIGAPVTAFALTGTFSSAPASATASASSDSDGAPHWTMSKAAPVKAAADSPAAGVPVYGYVAAGESAAALTGAALLMVQCGAPSLSLLALAVSTA